MNKNKRKSIIHEFDPIIYPLKLWVVQYPTPEGITEWFIEIEGGEIVSNISPESEAVTYDRVIKQKETGKYGILVVLNRNKTSINMMAHEATHAARIIWQWLNEDTTGAEADAYLVGWIAECISEAARPIKVKRSGVD